MQRFLIWTTGWQSWQPLRAYLESDQKNFVSTFTVSKTGEDTVKATIKDVLENTKTNFKVKETTATDAFSNIKLDEETISRIVRQEKVENDHKHFNGDEITWSNIKKPDMDFSKITKTKSLERRATRHELKIEVLLISAKGKTFRSRSKNISLSGSLLEDTIPFDYYDTVFDVVIINNHTADPLKARVKLAAKTVGDGLTQRIHYNNPTEVQKRALQTLLEDYIELQKQAKAS